MLDQNSLHLLELIRLAVMGTNKKISTDGVDWNNIIDVSKIQGISALILDAIEKLPASSRPTRKLLLNVVCLATITERMYAKYKEQLTSLAAFYKKYGIHVLLLKGYGCSLCYPCPEHRPMGDIDVYLLGKKDEADVLVEKELGIKVHREYHKHSTFEYMGVEVENHAKFIDDVSHKSNIRFERTLMSVLKKEECMASPIDNVLLPSPTFNALFLLRHTGEHFASNEITLRHVLDVGLFFQHYHSHIDWLFVFRVYKNERMLDFFNGIATICVEYLGINAACFAADDKQWSYSHDATLANRILADIFIPKDRLPMSTVGIDTMSKKFKYAMAKTCRWWHNRWKYHLVYDENLVESFWWLAKNRI